MKRVKHWIETIDDWFLFSPLFDWMMDHPILTAIVSSIVGAVLASLLIAVIDIALQA